MSPTSGKWWRNAAITQLSRSGAGAAVLFLVLDDGDEVITFPRLNWAIFLIIFTAILTAATAVMILVSTAHFDDSPTPTTIPPATCDLFCPQPT
ncbi:hypothetical protein AB0N05_24955 [Nocardia sp. NPDC051030]|uniref:hypothetical protein n=1 Tax=Nocardia sp. NPDC051030 TaxID=3155162 RepID=UPI003446F168